MSLFPDNSSPQALIVGASQGIGLGFVQTLLQDFPTATLFATYRQPETAEGLLVLQSIYPSRLICLPVDITAEDQIASMVRQIREQTPHLHLAINCVGWLHGDGWQPEKSLGQLNAEQLLHYFQVNSIGAVLLAKHLLPLFQAVPPGNRSIFACISARIGSIGDNHLGGWYGYRASKAALNMFMRTAAIEYGRKSPNTLVVTLHPGTTDTRLSKPFQRNVAADRLFAIERTVSQLLAVLAQLEKADSGHFFSWDGSRLPW